MPTVRANFQGANDYVLGKVYALESNTIRELWDAYARAYAQMTAELDRIGSTFQISDKWTVADTQARQELLRQITVIMNRLDPEVTKILFDNIGAAYKTGYYGSAYVLDSSVGQAMQPSLMPMLPTEAVTSQVLAPYLGQTWLDRYSDNRAEFEMRIKRALVQSQIQGESMTDARKRIALELGITPGSQLRADRQTHKRNFNRTMMIARSEIIRSSNLGAVAIYQANDDVLNGWEYKATLDDRTCPRCAPLDGRQFSWSNKPIDGRGGTDETLPPPIHANCRCAALPVLINKGMEERIVGKRETFDTWARGRGLTRNQYGQAFDAKGKPAPKTKGA